jgi:DNA-binding transcriptional ArsR family regulator
MDMPALSDETRALRGKVGEASGFLRKLSNPDRLLVACALADGERSVRALEEMLDIRQPGLSQQLAELREAGLIAGRRDGKQVIYRLADPRVETLVATLHGLFCKEAPAATQWAHPAPRRRPKTLVPTETDMSIATPELIPGHSNVGDGAR